VCCEDLHQCHTSGDAVSAALAAEIRDVRRASRCTILLTSLHQVLVVFQSKHAAVHYTVCLRHGKHSHTARETDPLSLLTGTSIISRPTSLCPTET
jgi:hypothetical protein